MRIVCNLFILDIFEDAPNLPKSIIRPEEFLFTLAECIPLGFSTPAAVQLIFVS